MDPDYLIRRGTPADTPDLIAVEDDAGRLFEEIGHDFNGVAPAPAELRHQRAFEQGAVLIAETAGHQPVGFALLWRVDGAAHIAELSVSRRHQNRGVGRALVARCADWAREAGLGALTLTTFRDVPWNGPYYRRLGFEVVAPDALGGELKEIRAGERRRGLDELPRVAMRMPLA